MDVSDLLCNNDGEIQITKSGQQKKKILPGLLDR